MQLKRAICAALVALVSLSLGSQTKPAAASGPESRQPTDPKTIVSGANPQAGAVPIDDLYYTRSVASPSWSPDGTQVVLTTNFTGRFNLWKVAAGGGWPIQLSQSDDRQFGAVWSRDGRNIVYQSDRGGGEIYDLFSIPSDGGAAANLTNTPDISETDAQFSPDGRQLFLSWKPRTEPVTDVAIMDWSTHRVRKLTNEKTRDHTWSPVKWSPDGKSIYANRMKVSFTDSDVYRIDVASGAAENLTPHQGEVRQTVTSVSPDGRMLLITSNEKGGFDNVALLDVATRQKRWVTDTHWEAGAGEFSPDGKWFTYDVNADGRTEVFLAETASLKARRLDLPAGINAAVGNTTTFASDGKRLLVSHQSSSQPADFWVYDVISNKLRQLTFSAIASLDPQRMPPSQLVHYRSFDGQVISAFLWVPFNLKRDGSNPGVVIPHGGPTGQTLDSFNRTAQALASRGYVVIAPNFRGSTGYGIAFQKANFQDLGGGDLQDTVYAAKFLQATGYVDAKKIGITGGSYGGFMTLMAVGKTPDVWAAAVELFGIIDWYTMLQHEDPFLQEYEKSLLGDPEKDREVYERTSPIKYIRNAKAPLLVLQGENDIRVPKEEAEQVVRILKEQGKTVDVKYYEHEGHGFARRENQIDSIRRTVEWFDRYLKNAPAAAQAQ